MIKLDAFTLACLSIGSIYIFQFNQIKQKIVLLDAYVNSSISNARSDMKSRKTCHPDRFMFPINDENILEMYFTNQKKILNVEVHSTDEQATHLSVRASSDSYMRYFYNNNNILFNSNIAFSLYIRLFFSLGIFIH